MKRQIGLFSLVFLIALGVKAFGDYSATQGSGSTVFSFTCFSTKICTTATLVNSAGTEIATAAVPAQVSLANTGANATPVAVSSATLSTAANQSTEIASLATIATNTGAAIPAGSNTIGNVGVANQFPVGSTPITISATGTTTATAAVLAANVSLKTYICGFSIRANATAAATADSTVAGTITGTLHYTQWTAPLASGIGVTEQIYNPCIPSSAINTAITITSAAPGTGGVVSVTGWGYQGN